MRAANRLNGMLALLKVQMLGAFGIGRLLNERNRKARLKLALAAAGIVLLAAFAAGYAWAIGSAFALMGAADALPALAVAVSGAGCVFSTFAKANGLLFGFKDFDLVVTMPIPLWAVALSHTAPLYGMGLALSLLMGGPLMAAYLVVVGAGPEAFVAAALMLLLAPAVPVAISVALSFLVAWAVSRVPNAHRALGIVGIVAAVAIVVGVMALTRGQGAYQGNDLRILASLGGQIESSMGSAWPPAAWASAAMRGDMAAFALYVTLSVVACAAMVGVLAKFLVPLNSLLAPGNARRSARAQAGKARPAFRAMVGKEFRLWVATPIYLMNTAIGPVLTLVAAVAVTIAGPQILASAVNVPGADHEAIAGLMAGAFPWVLALCMAMTPLSASSTSLEGNARWIAQTAPVSRPTLVGSKIATNLLVAVPAALAAGAVASFALADAPADAALMVAAPVSCSLLASCLGALLDVRRPRFDWASAYEPVKRSVNVAICVAAGIAMVFAGGAATLFAGPFAGIAATAVISLLSAAAGGSAVRVPLQDR